MWLAENTGRKKSPKIRHLGTIAQLCRVIFVSDIAMFVLKRDVKLQLTNCRVISLQPRHASTIGKNLLNSLQMSSQYANVGPLTAEIGLPVWDTPANFNWFHLLASLLQRCRSTEASQTLHNLWSSPGLAHYIYIFGGFCPLTDFWHVQNSLCIQVLRSRILAALLHGMPAAGLSQTLQRGTRNGITELLQRMPPILGWAAITLGISPHFSLILLLV